MRDEEAPGEDQGMTGGGCTGCHVLGEGGRKGRAGGGGGHAQEEEAKVNIKKD